MNSIIFFMLVASVLIGCSDQHAGGTVEIPNGVEVATLVDVDGEPLVGYDVLVVHRDSQFQHRDFHRGLTDSEGVLYVDSLVEGEYHLIIRDELNRQGARLEPLELQAGTLDTIQVALDTLYSVSMRSTFEGVSVLPYTDVNSESGGTYLPPGDYSSFVVSDSFGVRKQSDIQVRDSIDIELNLELVLLISQAQDSIDYAQYNQVLSEQYHVNWILDSQFDSQLEPDLVLMLPGSQLDSIQLESLDANQTPLIGMDSLHFQQLKIHFPGGLASIGSENANHLQLKYSSIDLPDIELNDAVNFYSESIQEEDLMYWAQLGSPAQVYFSSLVDPDHAVIFLYPPDQLIQPGNYQFSAPRVGFGLLGPELSEPGTLILRYMIFEALGGYLYSS